MSQTSPFLLASRGVSRDLGAFVVAARFSRDGSRAGFALGDGSVWTMRPGEAEWSQTAVHDGAILAFAADPAGQGFVSGGDDGQLRRISAEDQVSDITSFGMKWVEHLATYAQDRGKGLIAASAGKTVRLFDQAGQ